MKKLGFGLMRLPLKEKNDQTSIDLEEMKRMVDVFMKRGFTYFDTAYPYHNGRSEGAFREAVAKRYPRHLFTVTDKMPCWEVNSEADLERIFNEQLERCGVDYFDYYWLHSMNKDYVKIMDRTHGWEFVQKKKAEGKIRHIGFSFHDDSATLESILKAHPEMEYVQLQINYIDWNSPSVESKTCYELCERYGKPVIVMEPVKGGSLAKVPGQVEDMFRQHNPEASPASWAIRYAASLPNVMMVLSGMSTLRQAEDNTNFMDEFKPLDGEEMSIVARAAGIIQNSIDILCTACHYCTDGCPQNIAIPEYFGMMNTLKQFGESARFNTEYYYGVMTKNRGKASDCIECGQCEAHCPQHLPIIDNLKRVAATFEE
jgi:predicted aldo/keto reductase-like oxidoreductase